MSTIPKIYTNHQASFIRPYTCATNAMIQWLLTVYFHPIFEMLRALYFNLLCFFWNLEDVSHETNAPIQHLKKHLQMGVSKNRGTPKTPQNTPKWSILVGKPMVVGETHHCWKHPNRFLKILWGKVGPIVADRFHHRIWRLNSWRHVWFHRFRGGCLGKFKQHLPGTLNNHFLLVISV